MRRKHLCLLGLLFCLFLSGCNKEIDSTKSSVDFGDLEITEENVNKDYSIDIEQQTSVPEDTSSGT